MENRKQKHVTDIIKHVEDNYWKLTLQEFDVLESVLGIFQASDKREIDKIEHLVNDETERLLNLLSSYEIENYATEEFNLVSATDEADLVDALDNLNYDFSEKLSLEEHIEIVEDHGYQVLEVKDTYRDIVSQAMAHQWMELFENMTMQQRELWINQIRGER